MAVVAGVDFGTLSVRVTLVDSQMGPVGTASASYPLHRRREDPDFATQSHTDQMTALAVAVKDVLAATGISGGSVEALALDTTGSSVIPVGEGLRAAGRLLPLVRSSRARRGRRDHSQGACAKASKRSSGAAACIRTSGDLRSCCTGCGTIRTSGTQFVTALEHCDMVAATLCGSEEPDAAEAQRVRDGPQVDVESQVGRPAAGGISDAVDPLLAGVRAKMGGEYLTCDKVAGHLSRGVGREAGAARGDSDSGRRLRRALGCDRRGHAAKAMW